MKNLILRSILILAMFMMSIPAMAEEDGPPPPPDFEEPAGVPIDGYISILVIGGLLFAGYKMYKRKPII